MPVDYQPDHPDGGTHWIRPDHVRIDPSAASGPHDYVGVDAFTQRPTLQIPSYEYNHPKNYVGALVASSLEHTKADVFDAISETVIANPAPALRGAHALHLVEYDSVGNPSPTPQGQVCLRHLSRIHGTLAQARTAINNWQGTRTRFCNLAPGYGVLSDVLLSSDPAIAYLRTLLHATAPLTDSDPDVTLPAVVQRLLEEDLVFASAMFLQDSVETRQRVIGRGRDGTPIIKPAALTVPAVYRGTTTQQVKSILYHLGALTAPGSSTDTLQPKEERWQLSPSRT